MNSEDEDETVMRENPLELQLEEQIMRNQVTPERNARVLTGPTLKVGESYCQRLDDFLRKLRATTRQ